MDLAKLWAEHKKTIITTALVVIVGMLLIRFFDFIFVAIFLVALGVAAVLGWNHLANKYGGTKGALEALRKAVWDPS